MPRLQAAASSVEALRHEASTAQSDLYPTLSFNNTLSHTEYYFEGPASSFVVNTQNVAQLQLSWNIFDFGLTKLGYEAKTEEYLSQKATLEYDKEVASSELALAQRSLPIAQAKIEAAKAAMEAASAAYELIRLKYEHGAIDNIAYLDALRELSSAQYGYEASLNDYEIQKAKVLYYGGHDIKENIQ